MWSRLKDTYQAITGQTPLMYAIHHGHYAVCPKYRPDECVVVMNNVPAKKGHGRS